MNTFRIYTTSYQLELLLLIIMCLPGFNLLAQERSLKADSLFAILKTQLVETNGLNHVIRLSEELEETDSASSKRGYEYVWRMSAQMKLPAYTCKAVFGLGGIYYTFGDFKKARMFYEHGLAVANHNQLPLYQGQAIRSIGITYSQLGEYEKALKYYLKAVSIFESMNEKTKLTRLYTNIASLFDRQLMFDKAIYYCDKAISEAEKTGDSLLIADAYVYGGSPYSHAGNQEKFRDLILKAITILEAKDQNYTLLEAYLQISFYYVDAKDYRNADHYSDKALRLAHKLNITNPMTDAAILRARVLWEQHRFEEAKPFLAEAEIYSKKDGSVHCLRQYHTAMYMYNQEKGDYKQALFHYDLDRYLEDSLQNVQTQEATLAMEKKYQADTKQLQIEKLEKEGLITHLQLTQKERLIWMLLVMTILTGLLAASIFMYLKRKNQVVEAEKRLQIQRVKELETEKQLLATTSILKGQDEERARVARDLHDGLGGLLSGLKFSLGNLKGNMVLDKENADIFTKSLIQLDTVIGEMRRVAHSMMPESLVRFGLKEAVQDLCENISESGQSKIHFQAIGMEMGLDQSVSVAIYRIVQELVNNILKHANATEVQVQLVRDEKHIHLTIEDNGKGFDSQSVAHRRGAGLTNIQTRIDFLGGDLDIRSKPGEGTSVMIGITV